jgi:hypothetical protein
LPAYRITSVAAPSIVSVSHTVPYSHFSWRAVGANMLTVAR